MIGKTLEREVHLKASINNFWIRMALSETEDYFTLILKTFSKMKERNYFSQEVTSDLVKRLPRGRLSKFQQFLPARLEEQFIAERVLDLEGASGIAKEPVKHISEDQ